MFLNNFSVRVIGGTELPSGYVELNHNQTYKLALGNKNQRQADAAD
jgi:hypothetical protein